MKANIYLHIGLHKTGSSSIQSTLDKNAKTLLTHQINYPSLNPRDPNHGVVLLPVFMRAPHRYRENRRAGFDTKEKVAKKNAAALAKVRHTLKSNQSEKLVFSGEGIANLPAGRLARLRAELEPYAASFQVIAYVREPYSAANSMFQQRVRRGQTYSQIIVRPPYPHYSRIQASIEVFGRESVDIRVFDPHHFVGGDLIADFLSAIGAPPKLAKQLDVRRSNVALSHEAAYLMHAINNRFPSKERDSPRLRERPELLKWLAEIPGQPYQCPPELLQAAQRFITRELTWLHGVLGKKVFSEKPPVAAPAEQYWQEDTLTAIALKLDELAKRKSPAHGLRRRFANIGKAVVRLGGRSRR